MIIVFTSTSNKPIVPIAIVLHVLTLIKLHFVDAALLHHCLVVYNVEQTQYVCRMYRNNVHAVLTVTSLQLELQALQGQSTLINNEQIGGSKE